MHPLSKTSAAQSLPFDIIHEIFAYHATTLLIYSGSMPNTFPWFLGHVCASWRTVFLSMYPEFWSSLTMLPEAPLNTVDGNRSLDIVTTFMERTRGRPISLSLHLHNMPRPVIDIFIHHCKQWQHVELMFKKKQLWLLRPIKDQLPLLCSLRVGFTPYIPRGSPQLIVLFENAPLLTHVQLAPLWKWRFYWPSLSTLVLLGSIGVDMFLEALPQLENLEALHILEGRYDTDLTGSQSMPITMKRLKVLRTYGHATLTLITAPSLEVLHIETCMDSRFPDACSAFFERSACRLLGLSIGGCAREALAIILPFVPTLETLYMGRVQTSLADFLHALAEPLQLPQLHTIRFAMIYPITEEDVTALRSTITLRRQGPRPKLREILILPCFRSEVEDRVLRMLEKLERECEIQIKIKHIHHEIRFYDGNRSYFDIPFTTRLYK